MAGLFALNGRECESVGSPLEALHLLEWARSFEALGLANNIVKVGAIEDFDNVQLLVAPGQLVPAATSFKYTPGENARSLLTLGRNHVPHALALRVQVPAVLIAHANDQADALSDLNAGGLELAHLVGIVR